MRTRWLIAIVAACSSKQLLIEVDTGSDVDTVELMIVDGDCTAGSADCAGIGPPGVMSKPNGNVYYLDGDDRLAAKPVNGHARFALEPGKTDFMPRLLAVGFDTNDRANGLTFVPNVDVDQHLGEWWKIALEPRAFMQPSSNPIDVGANDAITLWRPPRDSADPQANQKHATCAMIQHADMSATDFVGPPGDPDCDTFVGSLECDASWYRHDVPKSPPTACLGLQTDGTCMLGIDSTCVDGTGKGGCGIGNVCIPTVACTACATGLTPSCVDALVTNVATLPRLSCDVPLDTTMTPIRPCNTTTATLDAAQAFPDKCSQPGLINAMAMPPTPAQSITFATGVGSGTITIKSSTNDPCEVDLTIDGMFTQVPGRARVGTFMLTGTDRRIAIPIVLNFHDGSMCDGGAATTCKFDPDVVADKIWTCAK